MTTPFAIYEDPEEHTLMSPTDMFDADTSFASDLSVTNPDDALPSIEPEDEHQDEPLPYKSSYTSRKSSLRRSSGATGYSFISGLPSESSISSRPLPPPDDMSDGRYSPRKDRPRFRNPESVRAMQMSSPPPMPTYEASKERLKGSYKLMTPSRSGRSETPVSKKSGSRRGSVRETHSPRPIATPQQAPLVLLHVTILPPQVPFSHDLMVRVMPEWLVENYKVLEEKLADIILMRRGLLIPHPRDEYDLLEERILESLELKTPRLLKCGHFVAPELESESESDDDRHSAAGDSTGRGSRMSGGTLNQEHDWAAHSVDAGTCMDCHRELKKPGKGVGAGRRKWDIKIYAANGLMREAAWAACWNDMERCDVEISPWIPDEVRKTLERRVQEEQEAEKRKQLYAAELQRQIQQSTAKQQILEEEAAERKRAEDARLQKSFEDAAAALERSKEEKAAEKRKFEDTLEEKIKEAKESIRLEMEAQVKDRIVALESALQDHKQRESTPPPVTVQKRRVSRASSGQQRAGEIPLGILLKNYILILLRDQRNFVIVLLSVVVVYLSLNMNQTSVQLPPQQTITSHVEDFIYEPVPTVSVTTTATTTATATSFSTFTVTEIVTATSVVEAPKPVFSAEVPEPVVVDEVVKPAVEIKETVVQNISEEEQVSPAVEAEAVRASAELKETPSLPLKSASQVDFSLVEDIFQLSLPVCAKIED